MKGVGTMPYILTEKLRSLVPYDPITGEYAIRLDANESFYNANDTLKAVITDAVLSVDLNRYPDPYAVKVTETYASLYGLNPQYLTAGNGSDELISIITACFLEKGDRVLTFAPDFSMYAFYPALYELEVLTLEKDEATLQIDVDAAIAYVKANNVKAVVFSNPCNPTSNGLLRDEVIKLITSVDALVILDEAYMDFWTQSIADKAAEYDNLIVLRTCSKALGLAGVRLGFAIANADITRALKAAKSPYNVNALTQAVANAVFQNAELERKANAAILASRDELYAGIKAISEKSNKLLYVYEPKTNFVFIRTEYAKQIFQALLARSIAIRFMGKYLRITAGSPEENAALLFALERVLTEL